MIFANYDKEFLIKNKSIDFYIATVGIFMILVPTIFAIFSYFKLI